MDESMLRQFLKQYSGAIWQQVWRSWSRLPQQAQGWMDMDDLYQEACLEAVRAYSHYDPNRKTLLSTFLIGSIRFHLANVSSAMRTKKRFAEMVYLDDKDCKAGRTLGAPEVVRTVDMLVESWVLK